VPIVRERAVTRSLSTTCITSAITAIVHHTVHGGAQATGQHQSRTTSSARPG
jgi:hypothetical protein